MGRFIRHLAMSCAVLSAFCVQLHAQNVPPVEAFGSLPKFSQPRLSPDGKYIASIQDFEGLPVAVIRPTEGGTPHGTAIPGAIVSYVQWLKNDRLMFLVKATRKDGRFAIEKSTMYRAVTVNPQAAGMAPLLSDNLTYNLNSNTGAIADVNLDDPDNVLVPLWIGNIPENYNPLRPDSGQDYLRLELMQASARNGTSHQFMGAGSRVVNWLTDGHGKVLARIDYSDTPLADKVFSYNDKSWKLIGTYPIEGDRNSGILGVAADGQSLVRYVTNERDSLVRLKLSDGTDAETIFSHPQYDVLGAIEDEWTGRVIAAIYAADKLEYRYFDPEREALQRGIEQAFPNTSAHAVSESKDRSIAIIAVDAPRRPRTYYILDRNTHQATELARTYPSLNESDLGEMKAYNYTARDGLQIPAYITLPPGRTARNLPAVVMPHGGPDNRDSLAFDYRAQFLANRGYVVLQPNFRGSSGYGRKFTEAGFLQWGLKMQDDITDGVRKMIADGIVDPKRICIVGASYGGYAALAGATFTPDLYACAASFAGISDLPLILRRDRIKDGRKSQLVSFWHQRMGSIYDDGDLLRASSPARHADKVKIPILLMHGENDTTVDIEQSEDMEAALKHANKQVKFIRFPGDDHYLSLSETRIKMLTELEQFLAQHIGSNKNAAN